MKKVGKVVDVNISDKKGVVKRPIEKEYLLRILDWKGMPTAASGIDR